MLVTYPTLLRRTGHRAVFAALALAGASFSLAQSQLLWSDEFDGTSLNPDHWEYMLGNGCTYGICGWGNNELQWYTARPENIFVADGLLHIVAREDYWNGHRYTSARIRSLNRVDFLYGRMEARIRLPQGAGLWPAFWMLPSNSPYGGWAASGEIDILEAVNIPHAAHGTLIYGGGWPQQVYNSASFSTGGNFADDFHVYTLVWEPDVMRWYVDGVPYHTVTSATWWSSAAPSNPRAPFDHPFHFLLNVAVGGDWPGPPNSTTSFPQVMSIDYVRVYDLCTTCPFHGAPFELPGRIEAEDFDHGGEGVAYHDADAVNHGGQYRAEGVDLQVASHGGYNVGWIEPGEWIQYTIAVRRAGTFDAVARVASPTGGGVFNLLLDGLPIGGDFLVPGTGGWQVWTAVEQRFTLPAGESVLRFANGASVSGYNLSYFDFFFAADINRDGNVDFSDVLPLLLCLGGPGALPSNPACHGQALLKCDIDRDLDLDLWDLAEFQRTYGG
ncbi:MAG: family 16 glycosylhydrolase [Phycisphaerales bacterium]|nr:family 16 glycosylhydrolase [Phycisphaerales bacterium]